MKNKSQLSAIFIALLITLSVNAQQGFGTSNPAPSSVIDMVASNKGALLPRVTLTSTTVAAPVTAPANALTVFNTATTGDVTPGYYYWSSADSKWIKLMDANIYTADGTLTNNRTLTIDGKSLNFLGSDQMTQWTNQGYFYQFGLPSSPYGNASMAFLAADHDSNGKNSRMDIQAFPEGDTQITANGDATSLALQTSTTTNSAPITFSTSAGGNTLGTEKMRITGEGNVGINNSNPTENLHVSGNVRFDNLPLNGATNAIHTMSNGSASSSQNQTFTATKIVVADANGVLGSITGIPLTTEVDGVIGNEVTNATTNGGLTRAGAGTSGSPYTLGLTSGTTSGQAMTWNGTSWAPAAATVSNTFTSATSLLSTTVNGVTGATVDLTPLKIEPWYNQASIGSQATANTQNIYQMGTVAIGANTIPTIMDGSTTINPQLHVQGDISTTGKLWTVNSVYADYVFEKYFVGKSAINPKYEFKSLEDVKAFIKANHHLPGVTAISDLQKQDKGYTFDMTQLSIQSLEKIEELYLHTLEQNDKIEAQQKTIEKLEKEAAATAKRLSLLEQIILKGQK